MSTEITLRDYARVLWTGRLVVLICIAIAVVVAVVASVASPAKYTAKATVSMGQATTISGTPIQTPYTNPTTAPQVLSSDDVIDRVADRAGVSAGRVRSDAVLTAPRVTGSQGNQPTVLTVTVTDKNRQKAIDIANAYAEVVLAIAGEGFTASQKVYERQLGQSRAVIDELVAQVRTLRGQLTTASGERAALLQTALLSATEELRLARQDAADQEILLTKAAAVEAPNRISQADSASSSGSAPNRVRAILLGAFVGLLVGILATFVWKGSPAGRAA